MLNIAEQNDRLRKTAFTHPQKNGRLVLTQGVASLPTEQLKAVAVSTAGSGSQGVGIQKSRSLVTDFQSLSFISTRIHKFMTT